MYGLLLDSIQKFLRETYGEKYWASIRRRAKLKNHWFVTHDIYNDSVMNDLVEAAAAELGEDRDTVMSLFGQYFVQNIGRYGYARLLRVLGRDLRDFLNGLDDLHEYLRFSYPKMRPPSFLCEKETPEGMLLHYTTCRRGYLCYVIGQLETVGKIYDKKVEVSIVQEDQNGEETHVLLNLKFDNSEMLRQYRGSFEDSQFAITSENFFGIFPFCIVFDQQLIIQKVGCKVAEVLPGLCNDSINNKFTLQKPRFATLSWNSICMHSNSMFELESRDAVCRFLQPGHDRSSPGMEYNGPPPHLKLKGQMLILSNINAVAFLCTPAMDSPEELYESGIFINDLSVHDSSRDFILAGSQQNPELSLALNQEKIRSAQLEESIQKTDELLYQMIPKPIADKLRSGEAPLNTCQEFSSVSILFSDIVSFTPMCSRLRPMEVVCVLNAMYVAFDKLCDKHHVYKMQIIGDGYMVISGAPVYTIHHAEYITEFAVSIVEATSKINDPSTNKSLRIRVGIHSGPVVAGVVGASILRYDVFGDTVNVAARMEATGEPMRIHISETTADMLQGTKFIVKERGKVEVKGKGMMKTYWVVGKKASPLDPVEELLNPFQRHMKEQLQSNGTTNMAATSPSPSPAPAPAPCGSLSQTPSRRRKSVSPGPKADNWPAAERTVKRLEAGSNRQRAVTLPSIDLLATESSARQYFSPTQFQQQTAMRDAVDAASLCTPVSAKQSVRSSRNNSIISDFNNVQMRDSLASILPTIPEVSHSHLAILAATAEENARQARKLADWLSQLSQLSARGRSDSIISSVDPLPYDPSGDALSSPPLTPAYRPLSPSNSVDDLLSTDLEDLSSNSPSHIPVSVPQLNVNPATPPLVCPMGGANTALDHSLEESGSDCSVKAGQEHRRDGTSHMHSPCRMM